MDREMEKRGLDALIVVGESTYGNPELTYVVKGHLPRGGIYLKVRGRDPVLVVGAVDLGSAERCDVKRIRTLSDIGYESLLEKYGYDGGRVRLYDRLLKEEGVSGRIGIYGIHELSTILHLVDGLRGMGHDVVGDRVPTILDLLRERKEPWELDEIRDVARRTEEVVEAIKELLAGCKARGPSLYLDNEPLTVGRVKMEINLLLAQKSLVAASDTIFAVGRSTSDPHYHGGSQDPVLVDSPIVLDIFPQNFRGYCFDMTRTMVVGRASRPFREIYEAVLQAQLHALDLAREGAPCKGLMEAVCDDFEKRGFATPRRRVGDWPRSGFTHSLGHGVGLSIGERPYLRLFSDEVLAEGHVVTVEPGLYDPQIGGARVEDVVAIVGSKALNLNSVTKELEI